ncbi:MAG: hypothetical protein QE164_00035 [Candidatus Nezhaarchaeota archaeon]|nr:hypothetical protein [Candidatus Nezhaarchaeota archaeon]
MKGACIDGSWNVIGRISEPKERYEMATNTLRTYSSLPQRLSEDFELIYF